MNTRLFYAIFLCSILLVHPWSSVFAATTNVKPDVRASVIVVAENKRMPSTNCAGKTPEEWIKDYVGTNTIVNNQIKFYSDLTSDSKQLEKSMVRLMPYSFKVNSKKTTDETGNKPVINARICAYQDEKVIEPPPAPDLIYTENIIDEGVKRQYWDWGIFSAIVTRGNIPQTNGVYDLQRQDITADPKQSLACSDKPPEVYQKDLYDKNSGKNTFSPDPLTEIKLFWLCDLTITNDKGEKNSWCNCKETNIYIKPDTTIPYGSYTACNSAGCKNGDNLQKEVEAIDPRHRADEPSQDSGGASNAFWHGSSSAPSLFKFIADVIGSPMGTVKNQTTNNAQGDRISNFSWSFTKDWEVSSDFLNCTFFPYAKRSELPECNVNWFAQTLEDFMKGITGVDNTANGTSTGMSVDTSTGSLDGFPESVQAALQHNIPADQIGKDWKAEVAIAAYNLTSRNPEVMLLIQKYAEKYNLPEKLVAAIMGVESYANKSVSDSSAGAIGLMQVLPKTADFQTIAPTADVLRDPEKNVEAGCNILRYWLNYENGNVSKAIQNYYGSSDSSGSYYLNKVLYFWQMLDSQPEFSTTINSQPVTVTNPFTTVR